MHVEVLVEELSAEAALDIVLPQLLGDGDTYEIRVFQGKQDLLRKLPERLRGYASWVRDAETRIVVLVDEDREDCRELKQRLEQAAVDAKLPTKSAPSHDGSFLVLNRIAVEELEAWFFGDCDAIRAAYTGVPASLESRKAFRDPDGIAGGTAERLGQVLREAGHHRSGYPKVAGAKAIAAHMDGDRNRSTSFQHFRTGIEELLAS